METERYTRKERKGKDANAALQDRDRHEQSTHRKD